MKRHIFILTVCLLAVMLGWSYRSIVRAGENIKPEIIMSSGDSSLFADVRVSCQISDQTRWEASFWQQIDFGGENLGLLHSEQRRLSARQAALLPRDNSISSSIRLRGSEYIYSFASGSYASTGSGDYMTIRRYALDNSESNRAVHLPVRAAIPGRGYNSWEAIFSFAAPPLVETEDGQYLIVPVDYRFRGYADIIRINRWKDERKLGLIDYESVRSEENDVYEIIASIDLSEMTNIGGIFLHGRQLLVIGAEMAEIEADSGQQSIRGKNIFIKRYDLQGRLVDSIYREMSFSSLQNILLDGDTLTILTGGEAIGADVFLIGESLTYWGGADLINDQGLRIWHNYLPTSFQVIDNKLYMASSAYLIPQLQEDGYTVKYIDGLELKSGYPFWDRQAIFLAVADRDGRFLYHGLYDIGINQDQYYKQNPEFNPRTDASLPERTIISLTIRRENGE